MTFTRLWTVQNPPAARIGQRPAEVIWDADNAGELLDAARGWGQIVRGPYVLESGTLSHDEARALLEITQAAAIEHGRKLPHQGGTWPPYDEAYSSAYNRAYLKLLAILGIHVDPSWQVSA